MKGSDVQFLIELYDRSIFIINKLYTVFLLMMEGYRCTGCLFYKDIGSRLLFLVEYKTAYISRLRNFALISFTEAILIPVAILPESI
jgi:hypothetical protein